MFFTEYRKGIALKKRPRFGRSDTHISDEDILGYTLVYPQSSVWYINIVYGCLKSHVWNFHIHSRSEKKKEKRKEKQNTSIYFNTNYLRDTKLVQIIIDYCLLQFDALKIFLRVHLHGGVST